MYKQMAAFAAALIMNPTRFVTGEIGETTVWGISRLGELVYNDLTSAHKLSILGAMRAAQEAMKTDQRAYNTLDTKVRLCAQVRHATVILSDLEHDQAVDVLITVARG